MNYYLLQLKKESNRFVGPPLTLLYRAIGPPLTLRYRAYAKGKPHANAAIARAKPRSSPARGFARPRMQYTRHRGINAMETQSSCEPRGITAITVITDSFAAVPRNQPQPALPFSLAPPSRGCLIPLLALRKHSPAPSPAQSVSRSQPIAAWRIPFRAPLLRLCPRGTTPGVESWGRSDYG